MRLSEIVRPTSVKAAGDLLRKAGYRPLGSGNHATVYARDGQDYVLRLFSVQDRGYLAYLALCRSHDNPHFPRFRGKLVRVTDEYFAIRTEHLQPFWADTSPIEFYLKNWPYTPDEDSPAFVKSYMLQKSKAAADFMSKHPELQQACDLIIELVKSTPGIQVDILNDNVMKRGNTLVLNDPVCNRT